MSRVADEFEVHCQAESLWERGTQAVDQVPREVFFGRVGRDGRQYAPYGPATAFLVLPHHALGRGVARAAGLRPGEGAPDPWREVVAAFGSLATATWAALAVAGLFRAARALGADPRRAALTAALLGGATFLWPYATFFYAEPISAALLVWGVAWHLEGRALPGAAAFLLAFLVKSTNLVLAPALALLPAAQALAPGRPSTADDLRRALRAAAPALGATLLAAVVHAEWNAWRFGDPLQFGYDWGELLRPGERPRPFLLAEAPRGLVGLLLSPGKSLFLFAPPLALALWRAPALWRAHRGAALAALGAGLTALLFFASYFYWEGGYAFGPRHLLPVVPLLLLPLACGPAPRRAALGAVVAIGVTVQALGVTVSFMEDQAMGERARSSAYYERHAPDDPAVPPGRPLNRYRLDYSPLVSYPRRLVEHLRDDGPPEVGRGLDLLPLHLTRVDPGLQALGRATSLAALALLAWASWRLRAALT
ncbi:MAG: hypothetical protein M9894_11785 [Planctomycetes bacterium]|nr:hypothetical protein [Planctomycetota bacterium]